MSEVVARAAGAPVATAGLGAGKVCAWCRPGVDAPAGHGICLDCLAKELAAAGLSPPPANAALYFSPQEISKP